MSAKIVKRPYQIYPVFPPGYEEHSVWEYSFWDQSLQISGVSGQPGPRGLNCVPSPISKSREGAPRRSEPSQLQRERLSGGAWPGPDSSETGCNLGLLVAWLAPGQTSAPATGQTDYKGLQTTTPRRVCRPLSRVHLSATRGLWPARLLCPWDFPDTNTGVGDHVLLQGIFPTQGLNPGLLHWRLILYCLSHHRSSGGKLWTRRYKKPPKLDRYFWWAGSKSRVLRMPPALHTSKGTDRPPRWFFGLTPEHTLTLAPYEEPIRPHLSERTCYLFSFLLLQQELQ